MYLHRAALAPLLDVVRRRPSPRRLFVWGGYAVGVVLVRAFLAVTRWIDDRIWPGIRAVRVESPVFVFGNARSGTTLLHRVLCADTEHFVSMALFESVFPRVCVMTVVDRLARLDARVPGRPLHAWVRLVDRLVFRTWEGMHEMGLGEVEEDEAIFTLALATPALVLAFPDPDALGPAVTLDERPARERRACLDTYDDALRRVLYVRGAGRRFLNKSVLFAPRIRSMLERYPDARLVYVVRHPFDAIASFLDMFHAKWRTHSPDVAADSPEIAALARFAIESYRRSLDVLDELGEDRFLVVHYDALVDDPRRTVLALYAGLGIEPGDGFRARLDEVAVDQRAYASAHRYALAPFGLSEDAIYDALREVFDRFGFAPPTGVAA